MTEDERKQLLLVRGHLTEALGTVDALLESGDIPTPPVDPTVDPPAPLAGNGKRVAVCIGHSRSGDAGVAAVDGTSEWNFNAPIGAQLVRMLNDAGCVAKLFDSYDGSSYAASMSWLAGQIQAFGADIAIELHFNSFNGSAQGYEYLHWHTSSNGGRLAMAFLKEHKARHPSRVSRGIKARDGDDRGALFLNKTHCPAIILEPFFGDNATEWNYYKDLQLTIAAQYAAAIGAYFNA